MPRIRTVKPEFYKNEELASLSESAFILAIGLLNYADDEGYFNANHLLIKAEIFPLRDPSVSIQCMLEELSKIGYIELLSGSDNKKYGRIINFLKHQKINRPTPSKIKALIANNEDSLNTHGIINESSLPERKGREQGKEGNNISVPLSEESENETEKNDNQKTQNQKAGVSEFHISIAKRIKDVVQKKKQIPVTQKQLSSWSKEIETLEIKKLKLRSDPKADILRAVKAVEHYSGAAYFPTIESGASFKEKFVNIEDYLKRSSGEKNKKSQHNNFEKQDYYEGTEGFQVC